MKRLLGTACVLVMIGSGVYYATTHWNQIGEILPGKSVFYRDRDISDQPYHYIGEERTFVSQEGSQTDIELSIPQSDQTQQVSRNLNSVERAEFDRLENQLEMGNLTQSEYALRSQALQRSLNMDANS